MHRTLTLDYGVVISGSIWLTLDSGNETEIKPGEIVLQRGTNHAWTNRGDVPCRICVIMVGAEMIKLADGTELGATKFGPPAKPAQ
jgi:quercetin dioxygenase-like cupin family protein